MDIIKNRIIKRSLFLSLLLEVAMLVAADGSISLKQLCAQVLINSPVHVFNDLDILHADRTSVESGQHISIPEKTIKKVLDQRAARLYAIPDNVKAVYTTKVTFSPNGRLMAVGVGNNLHIWCEELSDPIASIQADSSCVRSAIFMNDAEVLTAGNDNVVRIWNIERKECIDSRLPVSPDTIAFHSATRKFCLYGYSGAYVLDLDDTTWERRLTGALKKVVFAPRGNKIVTCDYYDQVIITNLETQEIEGKLSGRDASFNDTGDLLAVLGHRDILMYDICTGKLHKQFYAPTELSEHFSSIIYSRDKCIVRLSRDGICIFNALSGRLERFWQDTGYGTLVASPDGSRIAEYFCKLTEEGGDDQSSIRIYDVCYEKEEDLRLTDIEEQRLMLQAALCWKEDMPCPVDPNNPIFQSLLVRFPHLRKERYFVFSEPLPSAPMASSSTLSASSGASSSVEDGAAINFL